MTFHDQVDQAKYRERPIMRATITFYDAAGVEILSDSFRVNGKDLGTDTTRDREYQVQMRSIEKFRDAIHRLGALVLH